MAVQVFLSMFVAGATVASFPADSKQSRPGPEVVRRWVRYVEPTADEAAWSEIPWLASLTEGALEGAARRMPVLLWAMNGHPLGCT